MPDQLTLTTPQVVAAIEELEGVELPVWTLTNWAKSDVAVPSHWPRRKGRYNVRHYTLADLNRVRLIVRLRAAGLPMQRVRRVLDYLDSHHSNVFAHRTNKRLIVDGYRVRVHGAGADVEAPTGQSVFEFELGELSRGASAAARKARRTA